MAQNQISTSPKADRRDLKLALAASKRQQTGTNGYRQYNVYESPGTVSPEEGRPWILGEYTPPLDTQYIDTNQSLGANWTIEIVSNFTPTSFWATIWGNESWNQGLGHLAYLTSPTEMNVGTPAGTDFYNLSDDVSTKSYWVFTHTDGSGVEVYRNGVLLNPSSPGYSFIGLADNNLYIGARHTNNGANTPTDLCPGTYDSYYVSSNVLTQAAIQAKYSKYKQRFGI